MGLQRGMRAITEAQKEMKAKASGNTYSFRMQSGQSVVLRLYGDFEGDDAPVIAEQHFVKRLGNKAYQWCANNNADGTHAGCVFCFVRQSGGAKDISHSKRALFHIRDLTPIHKLDKEVRVLKPGVPRVPGKQYVEADFLTTKYPLCTGAKKGCQFCKEGNTPQPQGHRHWELALSYAEVLLQKQYEIRDFCSSCCTRDSETGGGTITASSYQCSHCKKPVDYSPENGIAHCRACGQAKVPLEVIECSACDSPQRATIQDFYWRVSKTGSEKTTSYQFEAVHPCKPPSDEELAEAEKRRPDFAALVSAPPADVQASLLGIPSPFAPVSGHGARRYDEVQEEMPPTEVDFGDADIIDAEPVKPKAKLKLKLKK